MPLVNRMCSPSPLTILEVTPPILNIGWLDLGLALAMSLSTWLESCCIQHGVGKDTIFAGAVALVTWPFGGPVWQLQHIAEVLLVTNDTPDGCTEATRHQRLPLMG